MASRLLNESSYTRQLREPRSLRIPSKQLDETKRLTLDNVTACLILLNRVQVACVLDAQLGSSCERRAAIIQAVQIDHAIGSYRVGLGNRLTSVSQPRCVHNSRAGGRSSWLSCCRRGCRCRCGNGRVCVRVTGSRYTAR